MFIDVDYIYNQYLEKKISKEAFTNQMIRFAYFDLRNRFEATEDQIQDLVIKFASKIDELTMRFQPELRSFHGFLMMEMKYLFLTNQKNKNIQEAKDMAIQNYELECYQETHCIVCDPCSKNIYQIKYEDPISQTLISLEQRSQIKEKISAIQKNPTEYARLRKKVLLYLLKDALRLRANEIDFIIQTFELNEFVTSYFLRELDILCENKKRKLENMNRIKNQYNHKIEALKSRIKNSTDELYKTYYNEILDRLQQRYEKVAERILNFKISPSNHILSIITQIPKGTIDSLFYKNKKNEDFLDEKEEDDFN